MKKILWIVGLVCVNALAGEGVRLEARGRYLIAAEVYLNTQGPFRFLVDTGSQSCAIRPGLAARLGVAVTGRVQQFSSIGSAVAATGMLGNVALGSVAARGIEVLITDLPAVRQVDSTIDGVLGQSFLERFDYLLDFKKRRLVLGPEGIQGEPVAFQRSDGRMAVDLEAMGQTRRLVIDSGAPTLVLFGDFQPHFQHARSFATVTTNSGKGRAAISREKVRIGSWQSRPVETALLPGSGLGLLPLSLFDALYVNNREGYVIFNPERRLQQNSFDFPPKSSHNCVGPKYADEIEGLHQRR